MSGPGQNSLPENGSKRNLDESQFTLSRKGLLAMNFEQRSHHAYIRLAMPAVLFSFLGLVTYQLNAAESTEPMEQLLQAKDFWSQTGAKLTHPEITYQHASSVREVAGHSADAVVRIRAYKVLADLNGRTRYPDGFSAEQAQEVVAAAFRYLESHPSDTAVGKFQPELGFSHVTLSKRAGDNDGVWLLIEYVDGVLPCGGLNIGWNAATKTVDQVEHWGTTRNLVLLK
jgi:hypothetical protein